jgi:hypothetical protein
VRRGIIIWTVLVSTAAIAQVGPSEIWGMIYNLVAPTLSDKQITTWQSTSDGHAAVTGLTPLAPCGSGVADLSAGCSITVLMRLGS